MPGLREIFAIAEISVILGGSLSDGGKSVIRNSPARKTLFSRVENMLAGLCAADQSVSRENITSINNATRYTYAC